MKKNFKIVLATQVRGKWWRVDYVNEEGKLEFETVEALDSNEAQVLTSNILFRRYNDELKNKNEDQS
jgi:hypothetical protein